MPSDDPDPDHKLERQTWVSEVEVLELTEGGNLTVSHSEKRGPVKNEDTLACACGRDFDDWELAAEHLRTVDEERDSQ